MKFSVLLSVSGIPNHYAYDLSYQDAKRAAESAGLAIDETEPGNTEYAYLAREQFDCEFVEGFDDPGCGHRGKCSCRKRRLAKYRETCERAAGIDPDDSVDFWWQWGREAQDLNASGILDRETFDQLIDE